MTEFQIKEDGRTMIPSVFSHAGKKELVLLQYPQLQALDMVKHCFTTRMGGVSKNEFSSLDLSFNRGDDIEAVKENFRRVAEAMEVPAGQIVCSDQTHTTNVRKVTAEDAGSGLTKERPYHDVDGLITDVPGLMLATFYADCVPLYFVDTEHHAIGLSNSGWRGTVGRMGAATIQAMQKHYGTDPKHLICAIGPSICQDCYEVSEDVADAFKEEFGAEISQDDSTSCYSWNGKSILMNKGNGKYQLDLWGANRLVLLDVGILPEHLAVTNVCTKCNPDLLYSHRVMGDKRGNLAAFLSLK